jgi:hypothetical protein
MDNILSFPPYDVILGHQIPPAILHSFSKQPSPNQLIPPCTVQTHGSSSCTESRLVRHWDAHQMQKIAAQWNLTDKL